MNKQVINVIGQKVASPAHMDGSMLLRHPIPNFAVIGQIFIGISQFFGFQRGGRPACRTLESSQF